MRSLSLTVGGMRAVGLVALVVLGLTAARGEPAQLNVIDLGTLGGATSEATALNNLGHVVGWSTDAGGATHAFLYRGGSMQDLGTLPGGTSSVATGINDRGDVVGYGGINEFGPQFREFVQAFIWRGDAPRALGALYCPCTFNQRYGTSAAYAISAAGQVVGDSGTVRGETIRHAFVWDSGGMRDTGGGAGSFSVSHAFGIDAQGRAVGSFDGRAALFGAAGPQDLGTLPGHDGSTARSINSAGRIVGESVQSAGGISRAFLWDGAMHDLGALPGDASSRAGSINSLGQVVGASMSADGVTSRAFVWQNGVMRDLNAALPVDSGWILTSAAAINDRGQIAGVGLHKGQRRAFLLWWEAHPRKPSTAVSPR